MKKIRKLIAISMIFSLLIISNVVNTYAISFSISAKNNQNGTVTVTVSGSVVGGFDVSVGSVNGQIAKRELNQSASVTLKTGAGTFNVKVIGRSISDKDYNLYDGEIATTSVTVTNKNSSSSGSNSTNNGSSSSKPQTNSPQVDNRSKENSLSSLTVSEGTLSPSFSATNTSYTVDLDGTKTKISISAKSKDSKAKVSGTGEKSLKVGKNEFVIKCIAENGSTKSYKIVVNVDEKPIVFTELNGQKLGVVRNLDGISGPNKSFEKTTIKLDGQDVTGWKSEQMGKTVVYLIDENNEKNYYVYEEGKVVSRIIPVSFAGINMFIVDIPKDKQSIDNMKFQELTVEKQKIYGWTFENEKLSNYELIYTMQENGQMAYYLHEKGLNTFTLYSEEFFKPSKQVEELEKEKDSNTMMRNVFIGTTVLFVGTSAGLLFMYLNFKKKSISAIKDYYDRKNQGE